MCFFAHFSAHFAHFFAHFFSYFFYILIIVTMVKNYECKLCFYKTTRKPDFNRHLNTKKHIKLEKEIGDKSEKCAEMPSKSLKIPQNALKITQNHSLNLKKQFVCNYCLKSYTRIDNFNRHLNMYCKKNASINIQNQIEEMKEEKKELMKKIDYLITRVGNTTINNTQNIQINSYGNEDLSHITEQLKTELLRSPYLMIPKFIEQVHFNSNKPENQNICISNKKENIIKVFTGNKWVYQDKEQVLNDLVDGKYFILDNHYEDNRNLLKDSEIKTYDKFRNEYDKDSKIISDNIKKQCELVILNNRL